MACAQSVWAKTDYDALALAQAEYVQGSRYFYGRGVEKDMDQALIWYKKSAAKGHAKAELAIAQVLSFSDVKNRRFQESVPWLIKAEGPHDTPQISGRQKAEADAKKHLSWMCKKGLVDFPEGHRFAEDPKCWLKRGNRLFNGSSMLDYYALKDKKKYYGVKKDYAASRQYLEKAFGAGEMEAAINLAKIYERGLGVPKDIAKFEYYTGLASEEGDGHSSYYVAEQALAAGDSGAYIKNLKLAAEDDYWKASSKLAWAYYDGEHVERSTETAFMYFFLRGQTVFVRSRDARHGDTRLPFFKNRFLSTFQTDLSLETLETAHQDALQFAKDNKFRDYQIKKIERSYTNAVSDFHYVKETGGEWHKSGIWDRIWIYFCLFVIIMVVRSVAEKFVRR